jgi:hypothetical protein
VADSSVPGSPANVRYDGEADLPVDAGTYAVTADFVPDDSDNYNTLEGVEVGEFVIEQAELAEEPLLSITNSPVTYDGDPQAAVVAVDDASPVAGTVSNIQHWQAGVLVSAPTNAGTYAVTVTFTPADPNYASLEDVDAGEFVISPAAPSLAVADHDVIYDGDEHDAPVVANPVAGQTGPVAGVVSNLRYGDTLDAAVTDAPVNAGTYKVRADFESNDPNYTDLEDVDAGSFVIQKATPTLSILNSPVIYDGEEHAADVVGSVAGTLSHVLYNGQQDLPMEPGEYTVTADFLPTSENYESLVEASAGVFVIVAPEPALTLVKAAEESSFSQVGDLIHYSYTLTNSGNVPLVGPFTIEDNLVEVTCPASDGLDVEAFISCTATYTVTAADIEAEKVTNKATGHALYAGEAVDSNEAELTVNYLPVAQPQFRLFIPLVFNFGLPR